MFKSISWCQTGVMNSKFIEVFAIVLAMDWSEGMSGQGKTLFQKFSNYSKQFFILFQNVHSIQVNLWTNQIFYKGFQNMQQELRLPNNSK